VPITPNVERPAPDPGKQWIDRVSAGCAIAALVLVTVAVVAPELDAGDAAGSRALALSDANAIGIALRAAQRDAGAALFTPLDAPPRWMFGPGVLPRDNAFARDAGFPLSKILTRAGAPAETRRGPYLDRVPIDPWGRAYVASFDPSRPQQPIFILSAGSDGVLSTTPKDGTIGGDDVGIILMP
jgi:hypothetical protein